MKIMLSKAFPTSIEESTPYKNNETLATLHRLIKGNDGAAVSAFLTKHRAEVQGHENYFACEAVEVFRKGRSPHALFALLEVGIDFLGLDDDGNCPIESLVVFQNGAVGRREEVRKVIKKVMDRQLGGALSEIEKSNPRFASFLRRVQKRTKRKPRHCDARGYYILGLLSSSILAPLMAWSVALA